MKLMIFDLDGTIIRPKSVDGNPVDRFPKDKDDWEFVPGILEKIKKAKAEGWKLAIVTNQAGIELSYITPADFKEKLDKIVKSVYLYISGNYDGHHSHNPFVHIVVADHLNSDLRKPSVQAYTQITHRLRFAPLEVVMVGDASGGGSFSDSDRKFLENIRDTFDVKATYFDIKEFLDD